MRGSPAGRNELDIHEYQAKEIMQKFGIKVPAGAVAESVGKSAEHKADPARLQELMDFAREHFQFEEGLMRSAGYPEAERHAKYHVSLLTELRTYCARLDQGVKTNPDSLIEYLWNWLLVHIDTADRELVAWLNSGK